MIDSAAITADAPFLEGQVQPASLDLRLGRRAWRIRASFLPGSQSDVASKISQVLLHEIDLTDGAVFEAGCVYIVELMERLAMPYRVAGAYSKEVVDAPRAAHGTADR